MRVRRNLQRGASLDQPLLDRRKVLRGRRTVGAAGGLFGRIAEIVVFAGGQQGGLPEVAVLPSDVHRHLGEFGIDLAQRRKVGVCGNVDFNFLAVIANERC